MGSWRGGAAQPTGSIRIRQGARSKELLLQGDRPWRAGSCAPSPTSYLSCWVSGTVQGPVAASPRVSVSSFSFFFFNICLFGHAMWHVGSLFPNQGSNLRPLPWKHGVLTTGPPGKALAQGSEKRRQSGLTPDLRTRTCMHTGLWVTSFLLPRKPDTRQVVNAQ